MMHLDWVKNFISERKSNETKVYGIIDSAAYMDIEPLYPDKLVGLNDNMRKAYSSFNVSDLASEECKTHYQSTQNEWRCIFGQYALKFIKTPYVMFGDQFDGYQMSQNVEQWSVSKLNANERIYALNFAAFTKEYFSSFPGPSD